MSKSLARRLDDLEARSKSGMVFVVHANDREAVQRARAAARPEDWIVTIHGGFLDPNAGRDGVRRDEQ